MSNAVVSILGASGYSGAELLKHLVHHPSVTIGSLFAGASAGKNVRDVLPQVKGLPERVLEAYTPEAACKSDLVFVALPSGEAMNIVPELLKRNKRVVDLGGDFRLDNVSMYEAFYKRAHTSADLLGTAVYGLPEWTRERVKAAPLVANPGCYPTSILLPLLPLVKERLIGTEGVVVNSLSGVSGAGRSSSVDLSFAEVNESVKAYKVGTHQHTPEIALAFRELAGWDVSFTFVPHLLPITRGIYTTISAPLASGINEQMVQEVYQRYYGAEHFVRFRTVPEIKYVAHTNYIDIGFSLQPDTGRIVIMSAIDNLVKGAAGQAIQNMNLMLGFNETEALL